MTETQEPVGESLPPAAAEQAVQAVDVQQLLQYLRAVVPALLEEHGALHPSFEQCLQQPVLLDKLRKFASDAQTRCLLVQRASVKGEQTHDRR